ncbi:MAG: ABC transporter permease [Oscillospiraceae bacterium]|nr:ABC transporter permease [Oscillospiraceae bacterium]
MFLLRNGLKTVYRSMLRSAVLVVLLTALIVLLGLSLCVNEAVNSYLDTCNESYLTIANLEYMGNRYPETKVTDPELVQHLQQESVDLSALSQIPGVLEVTENRSALAVHPTLHRPDAFVWNAKRSVIVIDRLFWDTNQKCYSGIISQALYAKDDVANKYVSIQAEEGSLDIDDGQSYVLTGWFVDGRNSYLWFVPIDMDLQTHNGTVKIPGCSLVPEGGLPEDSPYYAAAQLFSVRNNGLRMQLVNSLGQYYPFQQNVITLTDGRLYTPEEAAAGKRVCVVSEILTKQLDVSVGDTIPLSVLFPEGGLYEGYPQAGTEYEDYTIVGVYKCYETYQNWIFAPDSSAYPQEMMPTGYHVAQFRLENDQADGFVETVRQSLPKGFRLTVYDQGYRVAVAPFLELQLLCQLFLFVCGLLIAVVLSLYGYLFVCRQQESLQIMRSLGSGIRHILLHFGIGTLLMSLVAAAIGIYLGQLLEDRVMSLLQGFAAKYQSLDLRFSATALSAIEPLEFRPQPPASLYYFGAGLIALLALFSTVASCLLCREKRQKARRLKLCLPQGKTRSSYLRCWFKYALLSAKRGVVRSVTVIVMSIVTAVFFGQLTGNITAYEQQLADVKQNTQIRGYASATDGLRMDSLLVADENMQILYDSGLVSQLDMTEMPGHYRPIGVAIRADGTQCKLDYPAIPTGYALDTLKTQMASEPKILGTTSVEHSPAFYYAGPPEITWLEGYDETCMRSANTEIGVIPEDLAREYGVSLGDTMAFLTMSVADMRDMDVDKRVHYRYLQVVGTYFTSADVDTIFYPIGESIYATSPDYWRPSFQALNYDSTIFTVSSPETLPQLRQLLEELGYTSPGTWGRVRSYMVIDDSEYIMSTGSLERQIQYLHLVYGCLFVLVDLIGLAAAYLLLHARRGEIALMRSLGTPRLRIFGNLAGEQMLLSLVGCMAGFGLWYLVGAELKEILPLIVRFWISWCVGAVVSCLQMLGPKTLSGMNERE